ncbi:MAG: protein-export chaperone SecB [Bacteroidia bacterium]|nr:protein-export chaperone SecB [Bacteroidia bacterium]
MIADFQLIHYKVDELSFKMYPGLELVMYDGPISDGLSFQFEAATPTYFKSQGVYIVGLKLIIKLSNKPPDQDHETEFLNLSCSLAGAFRFNTAEVDPTTLQAFLKLNALTVLLPYLRSVVTTLLATGGFGAIRFPLFNMTKVSKDLFGDEDIEIEIAE